MQIHELNNFNGTLGSNAYLAIDGGRDTGKISSQQLLAATEARIDNIIAGDAPSAAEVTDARLGADGQTYTSLGTAIRTQVSDLKSDVINSNNKAENFGLSGSFVNAGLSSGNLTPSTKYRVASDTIFSFDRDIVLTIKTGFKIGVHTFVNGSYTNDSGWITGTYAIEANRTFKVVIARVTENTSEIANISEFVNAVTFNTNVDNLIKDARGSVTLTLLNVDTEWGNLTNGNNDDDSYNYNRRIRTVGYISVEAGDVISNSTNGIKYGVHLCDYNKRFISDSGWQTGEYTIPQGGYVRIVFVRTDDDLLTKPSIQYWVATYKNGIKLQTSVSRHLDAMNARVNEFDPSLSKSFYYDGEKIDVNKYGYEISQLWNFSSPTTAGSFVKEASAYYGGVVFKCYNTDLIQLYNFADGTKIAEFPITCGHGDCIDFSNEYYASSDEFPLCYITADTNPATVYVNRITRSGATLVRTLTFPLERTGYYAGHCVDPINNVLYQIGYKNNDYQNPDNGNHMIVTKWDLSELTDNGNNTFTPAFLDTFDLPFMDTAQGQVMLNGKVFIMSSNPYVPADGRRTRVYVVDVGGQRISNILSEFWERIREHEGESVFFVPNGHNAYDLIVDIQATGLYKIAL